MHPAACRLVSHMDYRHGALDAEKAEPGQSGRSSDNLIKVRGTERIFRHGVCTQAAHETL
jgi:hypothetical protein